MQQLLALKNRLVALVATLPANGVIRHAAVIFGLCLAANVLHIVGMLPHGLTIGAAYFIGRETASK